MLRRGLRPETRKMVCPINTVALRKYVDTAGPEADEVPRHKDGRSYGKTMRDLARAARLAPPALSWRRRRVRGALAPRVRIATQHPYSRSPCTRSPRVLGLAGVRARRRLHLPPSYSTTVRHHVPLPWPPIGLRPMVCESGSNQGPQPATPAQRCVGFSIGVCSLAVK